MNSIAGNQGRSFLQLFADLRPHFRTDRNLPARIQQRLAGERRFGSRDRRLYRELLYTAVRYLPWIEERQNISPEAALEATVWLAAPLPALKLLKAEFGARLGPTPAGVAEKARALEVKSALLPDWTATQCPEATVSPNLDVLHTRAPLWLRLQTADVEAVLNEFTSHEWKWQRSPVLADAVEVLGDVDVASTKSYLNGRFEVQDIASQLLLHAVGPATGTRWLDACAGAGGKTLQLAQLIGSTGHVVAQDIRPAALMELAHRARRAGLRNVSVATGAAELFDGVLVDAPCTGMGTWRRSPHLKWCTTPAMITAAAQQQRALLDQFSQNVKPGGLLVYATCSLCREENDDVVAEFLAAHSEFTPAAFARDYGATTGQASLTFRPAVHNSDGFFVAALRRT